MRISNMIELNHLMSAVNAAKGQVFLCSSQGDKYNLKSTLIRYVVLSSLFNYHNEELTLVCEFKEDEKLFAEFIEK